MVKKLGFDLDGVLYPWHLYVWEYLYNSGQTDYTYDYFWTYVWKIMPDKFWHDITRVESLFRGAPFDGAVDVVNKCAKKYDVFYLTKREKEMTDVTSDFLVKNNFPNSDELFIIQYGKEDFISKFKTDYYVEDRADYLKSLQGTTSLIGVRQRWNDDYYEQASNNGIVWINNILELPKVLGI
jgi:uncharacterized HAD superfamily protein